MPTRSRLTLFCTVFLLMTGVLLPQVAFAQSSGGFDPFTLRAGGFGDQMMGPDRDRGITLGPDEWDIMSGTSGELNYRPWGIALVYVPSPPPVLGERWSDMPVPADGNPLTAFDREMFYGSYAVLAGRHKLWPEEIKRLAAYRVVRRQLLDEIRAKFTELAGATPEARQAGLAALGVRQEDRLQALAAEAESVRKGLDWVERSYQVRAALFGNLVRRSQPVSDASRIFSAVYFDGGLSPEQRLLLVEMAYGLSTEAPDAGSPEQAGPAGTIFFWPATSRLRLPPAMPPELVEKIRTLVKEKEGLKDELRREVLQAFYFFDWTETARLGALAAGQAPRFARLDALAEEIRLGLAALDYPPPQGGLDLPAELTRRVGNFYERKMQARRELVGRLRQLRAGYPDATFAIVKQGDGLAIVQTDVRSPVAAGLIEFNASQARRYAAFAAEIEGLRRDIQSYLDRHPQQAGRSVDQLAADFVKASAVREGEVRYRDYTRAVLEPGLSPAQRRLLLQAGAEETELPGETPQT